MRFLLAAAIALGVSCGPPPVITNNHLTIFRIAPSIWTGAVNTKWEEPLNWAKGKVPDAGSDVYINAGVPRYPEISSEAFCRKLYLNPAATLKINDNYHLSVGVLY